MSVPEVPADDSAGSAAGNAAGSAAGNAAGDAPGNAAGNAGEPWVAATRVLISDSDRGRIADAIGGAFAEGRLTREEYDDRLTAAMSARTVGDLVPVVEGLPPAVQAEALAPLVALAAEMATQAPSPAPQAWQASPSQPQGASSTVVAVFGGATRKGEWIVPPQMTAFAMFGGVELDLTRVSFAQASAEIIAVAVMGGVEITVPPGLTVHVDGVGIFGGFDQKASGPGDPGSPVLRIKGAALFGGVEVKRAPLPPTVNRWGSDPQLPRS